MGTDDEGARMVVAINVGETVGTGPNGNCNTFSNHQKKEVENGQDIPPIVRSPTAAPSPSLNSRNACFWRPNVENVRSLSAASWAGKKGNTSIKA
jgi:hypothetical protein